MKSYKNVKRNFFRYDFFIFNCVFILFIAFVIKITVFELKNCLKTLD